MHNSYNVDEDAFIYHLQFYYSRPWAEAYFNLLADVIDTTDLASDDSRIVTSVMRNIAYFPITINNRYVLVASKYQYVAYVICQRRFYDRSDLHQGVVGEFGQLPGERSQNEIPPIMVQIAEDLLLPQELRESIDGWKQTLLIERVRAVGSPYKRFHNPFVYKAATDKNYQKHIFDLVFNL